MNNNILNLVLAVLLSVAIIFGWRHFYEKPRVEAIASSAKAYHQEIEQKKVETSVDTVPRESALSGTKRILIKSDVLSGSISLVGLRFDDLTLLRYKQDISKDSKNVELFSPAKTQNAYFAELGWLSSTDGLDVPDVNTVWQADKDVLVPGQPVSLTWQNSSGVKFIVDISVDEDYLFTITQSVQNNLSDDIKLQYYALINENEHIKEKAINILHQGPIGVVNGELQEYSYEAIKEKGSVQFQDGTIDWLGTTDKYWLTAFILDKSARYSANFHYAIKNGFDKFQVDYVSSPINVPSKGSVKMTQRLFAGAKKVALLDKYESSLNAKLFDRAIDFGWFYIITKPLFNVLNFFYSYVGNFGISILIVTVLIKLCMFSLANRSYRSMKKMKDLQPEIERIKALYSDDRNRINQEVMAVYKRFGVNPLSGCLPLLIQIPVFFSLYKVLYVTIEMRHAHFFAWIKDLSAPDPTSIFNLFGLLPIHLPNFLMIGVWPILMAITMYLQQRMSPPPADPTQAQVMKFMPLIFLAMFSSFPAGLLIYWSWNNILSILQQYYINKLNS